MISQSELNKEIEGKLKKVYSTGFLDCHTHKDARNEKHCISEALLAIQSIIDRDYVRKDKITINGMSFDEALKTPMEKNDKKGEREV